MPCSRWRVSRVFPSGFSDEEHLVSSVSHRPTVGPVVNPRVYLPSEATFTSTKATFCHSNLHVLYVSNRDAHSFSERMLTALLKAYKPSWNFNHIRVTNLCSPPVLPRTKPPMETATSTLLIINNLHDLAPRVQAVLRRYCTQCVNAESAFLVLINVPRRHRCTLSVLDTVKVRTMERIRTTFLLGFLPEHVRNDISFRVMATAKIGAKSVVKKVVKWLRRHNQGAKYVGKLEHSKVRKVMAVHPKTATVESVTGPIRTSTSRGLEFRRASSRTQEYLLLWLEIRNSWKKWRGFGSLRRTKKGERKTSNETTSALLNLVVDYCKEYGILNLSSDTIKFQLEKLEEIYRDARELFGTAGEGVTQEDIEKKIISLKDKVVKEFPFFERLRSILWDSSQMVKSYAQNSMDDAEQFLLGNTGSVEEGSAGETEQASGSISDETPSVSPKPVIQHEHALPVGTTS